ncbi:MAG: bifunctional (p)ppGpp synthetase/guanosine-3',5'-bis(diphosphate) 3'-pyrophosphohydrolase [Alphaproteobacteria bacterium]|nr:bifunctional (p)ppGpp synthetase/guanosine-3',5'-bis(diphosphate) 3'-pyrophosphohydrolase [Alphaproteobacteria bacterium]
MIRQYELVERVRGYEPTADEDLLNRAYVFSMRAHGPQRRASGDPYFSHPVEVAGILTDLKLDSTTIVTALLHDTVEDTLASLEEIEDKFGTKIARLVDGVTKLSRLELQSDHTKEAENFRKFLLAMSEDIRVLLVKLADRLHNMRTLHFVADPAKRRRIALQTMDIYAPLAERIGLLDMKDELEDLAFAEINPEARNSVLTRLEFLRTEGGAIVPRIIEALNETLAKAKIRAQVTGREKKPYSIWRKMEQKNVSFEQLSDVVAFRIVVESEDDCYRVLGVVHRAYRAVPGRFKDYLSTPKPNGYHSLHTAVIGPERRRIEIQVRTREMHEEAEFGVAAHWAFKQGTEAKDGRHYRWIRELLEILDKAAGPEEFLENTKLEMFRDQVFAFTPKGELITLPRGATAVDFAYAVHSDVGDTCVGAKINGRMVPLRTELANGDQVEIIRAKIASPSPTWERFVVTGKARAHIRRFIRGRQRQEYVGLGRAIVQRLFRQENLDYSDAVIADAAQRLKLRSAEDLFVALGDGTMTSPQAWAGLFPGREAPPTSARVMVARPSADAKAGDPGIPIKGLTPGVAVHMATCCSPLPGDRIVGIVTTGKGVTVHTIDCDTLEAFHDMPENWLDLSWDVEGADREAHVGRLSVTVVNEPGSLGALAGAIGRAHGNITNLKIAHRAAEFFEFHVDVEVRDVKHLSNIVAALRAVPSISQVERMVG